VESVDEGSKVVRLPASGPMSAASASGDHDWLDQPTPNGRRDEWSPQRILVVEPDPGLARLLCVALRSRGWVVDPIVDPGWTPGDAIADEYALIILDLNPGPAGETVLLTTLAALASSTAQRVFVISDTEDREWVVRCFNAGVVDYLPKPFVLMELLARIQARMRLPVAPTSLPDHVTRRGGVVIDEWRRTADVGRGPVKLSAREFVLLQYLMSHEGQICSREELMSIAWGLPVDPGRTLVEAYVRRVRVKLGSGVIETVHRRGYAFVGGTRSASRPMRVAVVAP
jgi:DNA-binding response OmpR family regulator